jgi:hypothetical protein
MEIMSLKSRNSWREVSNTMLGFRIQRLAIVNNNHAKIDSSINENVAMRT